MVKIEIPRCPHDLGRGLEDIRRTALPLGAAKFTASLALNGAPDLATRLRLAQNNFRLWMRCSHMDPRTRRQGAAGNLNPA